MRCSKVVSNHGRGTNHLTYVIYWLNWARNGGKYTDGYTIHVQESYTKFYRIIIFHSRP